MTGGRPKRGPSNTKLVESRFAKNMMLTSDIETDFRDNAGD